MEIDKYFDIEKRLATRPEETWERAHDALYRYSISVDSSTGNISFTVVSTRTVFIPYVSVSFDIDIK